MGDKQAVEQVEYRLAQEAHIQEEDHKQGWVANKGSEVYHKLEKEVDIHVQELEADIQAEVPEKDFDIPAEEPGETTDKMEAEWGEEEACKGVQAHILEVQLEAQKAH